MKFIEKINWYINCQDSALKARGYLRLISRHEHGGHGKLASRMLSTLHQVKEPEPVEYQSESIRPELTWFDEFDARKCAIHAPAKVKRHVLSGPVYTPLKFKIPSEGRTEQDEADYDESIQLDTRTTTPEEQGMPPIDYEAWYCNPYNLDKPKPNPKDRPRWEVEMDLLFLKSKRPATDIQESKCTCCGKVHAQDHIFEDRHFAFTVEDALEVLLEPEETWSDRAWNCSWLPR